MKNILLILCFPILACSSNTSDNQKIIEPVKETVATDIPKPDTISPPLPIADLPSGTKYPWTNEAAASDLLINRIAPPPGFSRTKVAEGSYAQWLRHLPLKEPEARVMLYNGAPKGRQDVHEAVVNIDVGTRDLQQCADAVMRLRSEYFYSRGAYADIHFNFTSGDKVSFDDWRQGRKPRISGNNVVFSQKSGPPNNSYANFKSYLIQIFSYAGTSSLSKELKRVAIEDMKIGDVFIKGGFPGHAVLVVDMAVDENGEKVFLLAQSYMPAQNIHILRNQNQEEYSPWYRADFGPVLYTPEWSFDRGELMGH